MNHQRLYHRYGPKLWEKFVSGLRSQPCMIHTDIIATLYFLEKDSSMSLSVINYEGDFEDFSHILLSLLTEKLKSQNMFDFELVKTLHYLQELLPESRCQLDFSSLEKFGVSKMSFSAHQSKMIDDRPILSRLHKQRWEHHQRISRLTRSNTPSKVKWRATPGVNMGIEASSSSASTIAAIPYNFPLIGHDARYCYAYGSGTARRECFTNGLWLDYYSRGEISYRTGLTSLESLAIDKYICHETGREYFLIPFNDSGKDLIRMLGFKTMTVKFNDRQWTTVRAPVEHSIAVINELAKLGMLPAREDRLLLATYRQNYKKPVVKPSLYKDCNLYETLFIRAFHRPLKEVDSLSLINTSATLMLSKLVEKITKQLEVASCQQMESSEECRVFYCKLLLSFARQVLAKKPLKPPYADAFMLALVRIDSILQQLLNPELNYHTFLKLAELAIDNFVYLKGIKHLANIAQRKKGSMSLDIIHTSGQFFEQRFQQRPAHARPHTSGMNALNSTFHQHIRQAQAISLAERPIKVHVNQYTYYELSACISLHQEKSGIELAKVDEIVDVLVTCFDHNFQVESLTNKRINVLQQIKKQLDLRQGSQASPLQVIIDLTLTDPNSPCVKALLSDEAIKHGIASGALEISFCLSTNKFFSCGTDRLPGGFTAQYYNPDELTTLSKFARRERRIEADKSVNGLSHDGFILHAMEMFMHPETTSLVDAYQPILKERVVSAYEVMKHNFAEDDIFALECIYPENDQGLTDLEMQQAPFDHIKPYLHFQLRHDMLPSSATGLGSMLEQTIGSLRAHCELPFRAGFGFSHTSYIVVTRSETQSNAYNMRICPGTESAAEFSKKMLRFSEGVKLLNQITKKYMRLPDFRFNQLSVDMCISEVILEVNKLVASWQHEDQLQAERPLVLS